MREDEVGLCASCRYGRWIQSGKGSRFLFCRLSETDPRFPKYPRLPVLRCPGYEGGDAPTDRSQPPRDP